MLDFLHQLLDVNDIALGIVAILSAMAAFLLREALESDWVAALSAPIFFFGSLATIRSFTTRGIAITADESSDIVVATGCGLILSLLLMLIAARAYISLTGGSGAPLKRD